MTDSICSLSQLTELNINSNTQENTISYNTAIITSITHYATSLPQANLFGGWISIPVRDLVIGD